MRISMPWFVLSCVITAAASGAESPAPPKEFTNSIGMKFVLIPAGEFQMGHPADDVVDLFDGIERPNPPPVGADFPRDYSQDERPQHRVVIQRPFYLAIYETTQSQWSAVMDKPTWFTDGDRPNGPDVAANWISWTLAVDYCRKLSEKEGKTYRLPSEAEWEYACRAGTTTRYSFGDDDNQLGDYAWWGALNRKGNTYAERHPHAVGRKRPNPWGLYDMHGNVWEFCNDWYDRTYYEKSPDEPQQPNEPIFEKGARVVRGGSFFDLPIFCRSANRDRAPPDAAIEWHGFRVVLVP